MSSISLPAAAVKAAIAGKYARQVAGCCSLALLIIGAAQAQEISSITDTTGSDDGLETISVIGRNESRTSATITPEYLETQVDGVSPLAVLKDLPGVNVQTSDPFGLYEWNNRLRMRGFDISQIGQTIDGIPFISGSEGGYISRYLLPENMAGVQVAPGSGDVTQPAMSALGGAVRYLSRDPGDVMAGKVSGTVGRYDMLRTFASFDTGLIGSTGIKGYLSGARSEVGAFENPRYPLRQDRFETKFLKNWGANSINFAFRYDYGMDHDTQNVALSLEPDYANSGQLNSSITGDSEADAFWVGYWRNGRNSRLLSSTGKFELTDKLKLEVTPYYEAREGWLWYGVPASTAASAYAAAMAGTPGRTDITEPNGLPAQRLATRNGSRGGLTTGLTWYVGRHTLQMGGWVENATYDYYLPLQNTDPTTGEILVNEVITINADYKLKTDITTMYLKDSVKFLDGRLTLDLGSKGMDITRHLHGYANIIDFNSSTIRDVSPHHNDWFQPQAGLTFNFTDATQGFINYAENYSAIPSAALSSTVYNPDLKPETSENLDLGVRTQGANWSGYVSVYGLKYHDRIIALSGASRASITGTSYLNVNNVSTKGMEASGEWHPIDHWKFTSSVSYIDAKYQDNYYAFDSSGAQTVLVAVDGNQLPDQAKWVGSMAASYSGTNISASLDGQYMGERYGDSKNTIVVPSYTIFNGSVGYKGSSGTRLEGTNFQIAIYNLLDKGYISAISPGQSSATFKRGYPRAWYLSVAHEF
ncbi:MAG: TonB-dependent receptor [Steroidobacteraceae bacterium]